MILSIRGLNSGSRMGLVLLLWPGVELVLFEDRCELSRCGSGNRTMAGLAGLAGWCDWEEDEEREKSKRERGRPETVRGPLWEKASSGLTGPG